MGILGDILSPRTINKTVDSIIDSGDALFFTDEEKSKANQLKVETKLKILPLFEPFKKAQRYLSILFAYNYLLSFWVGVSIYFLDKKEYLTMFLNLVNTFHLGWIMLAIISFYFGGGFIDSLKIKK